MLEPTLPKSIVGWVRKYAAQNYWRMAEYYEISDLVQDGLMTAWKCRLKYPHYDDKQLMGAVKSAFYNQIGDLVRKKMRSLENLEVKAGDMNPNVSEGTVFERYQLPQFSAAELAVRVSELPVCIRKALELLSTDEGALRVRTGRMPLTGPLELDEARLRWLAGVPDDMDFEQVLMAHFST